LSVKDFLIQLSNSTGVSGFETERAGIVLDFLKARCDEAWIDNFGNVIGLKKGQGKGKLLLSAHMDEIGLMVANINEKGFIGITQIGGFDQRTLLAHEVIIHGREKIYGVIGVKPPHLTSPEEAKKSTKLEHLYIDTGYNADELKKLVSIGDIITINREAIELKNNRLAGKCMDDTAGIAAYVIVLDKLKDYNHDIDVYFVASAQEEVGLRGAKTVTNVINPDIGIALEVGFGRSAEGSDDGDIMLGDGVEICCGPNINRKVYNQLKSVAKENGVKYQVTVAPGPTGTDANIIQITNAGVATSVLGIPTKYMHTSVEMICLDDIDSMGRLLTEFIISLNGEDLEEFLCM
jgi:endoglucanase